MKNEPRLESFQVLFAGDTSLRCKSGMASPFTEDIIDLFRRSSCVLLNLETALSEGGRSKEKSVVIKATPDMANRLKEAGVNAVNLANNHTLDYGVEGFRSTLATLDAAGVRYFGALQQGGQRPFEMELDGCRIGVLGYTFCGPQKYDIGVASLHEGQIKRDIGNLKKGKIDRVIVSLHWGEEYVAYPSPQQQRIARGLIDSGADVILGHHSHFVQGIEGYRRGVIFYSLGNFNFINSSDILKCFPGSQWGIIAMLSFSKSLPVEYSYIPVQIDSEYRPRFAPKAEAEAFQAYLNRISKTLNPEVKKIFWLKEASAPYFKNHIPSFIYRIKKYGLRHFLQMLRWMISPHTYGFYLGFCLMLMDKAMGRSLSGPVWPRPRR